MDKPDNNLINDYLAGNAEDFNVLYERYKRPVYAYLNRLLAEQHGAIDDVFQQVWLKVLKRLPRYHNKGRFLSWLMRITHNAAMDFYRRSRKHQNQVELDHEETPELDDRGGDAPWKQLHCDELGRMINDALDKLPRNQMEVFMLRSEKISFKEIADIQHCSINTALARMQYAIKNLRKELINVGK